MNHNKIKLLKFKKSKIRKLKPMKLVVQCKFLKQTNNKFLVFLES